MLHQENRHRSIVTTRQPERAGSGTPPPARRALSGERLLAQVHPWGEVLFEVRGGDPVFHMDFAVLDAAHVELDHRFVVLRADVFGALRMLERLLDLHTLERL